MLRPKAPCKNCLDRTIDCHNQCEHYISYKNSLTEFNEICNKRRYVEYVISKPPHLCMKRKNKK